MNLLWILKYEISTNLYPCFAIFNLHPFSSKSHVIWFLQECSKLDQFKPEHEVNFAASLWHCAIRLVGHMLCVQLFLAHDKRPKECIVIAVVGCLHSKPAAIRLQTANSCSSFWLEVTKRAATGVKRVGIGWTTARRATPRSGSAPVAASRAVEAI